MREQLLKAMKRQQLIDIIYMAKNSTITKRRVKVLKIAGDSAQVYCYTKKQREC